MPETVLFENEQQLSRDDAAAYLRSVADSLSSGDDLTLNAGDQSVTLDPPSKFEFEVKAEREGPTDGDGELSLELELEWPENPTNTDLSIE